VSQTVLMVLRLDILIITAKTELPMRLLVHGTEYMVQDELPIWSHYRFNFAKVNQSKLLSFFSSFFSKQSIYLSHCRCLCRLFPQNSFLCELHSFGNAGSPAEVWTLEKPVAFRHLIGGGVVIERTIRQRNLENRAPRFVRSQSIFFFAPFRSSLHLLSA
jgi:hypothetical protein